MKLFADMDSNQFWIVLWSMVVTGLLVLATIIAVYNYKQDMIVKDLIEKNYPIADLACMYNLGESNKTGCMLYYQNQGAKLKDVADK